LLKDQTKDINRQIKKDNYGNGRFTIAKIRDFYRDPVDGLEAGRLRVDDHGRASTRGRRSSTEFK
jgi:hypothetical protein